MEGWAAAAACTAAALASAAGATAVALRLVHLHLLHYAEPTHQRFIVRIILMVPVYAVMSFLSLVSPHNAIYFNSIREIYDAWVIYNFFSLCLAWVGGPGNVVVSLSGQHLKPSWFQMTCCLPAIPLDGRFIRRCKQGCLQFVILKPILVVITFILYAKGKYEDGNFSVNQSYLYITIIYTISYSMALFALALFYAACRDLLQPYNPVPKFIMIKSVVFLTYWQRTLCYLIKNRYSDMVCFLTGCAGFPCCKIWIHKKCGEAAYLQNFVLCVEMLIAAIGHQFSFSYKEYAGSNARPYGGFRASLLHALKFSDFYHDTVHQFAPTYHEYVLYSNEAEDEPTKYSPSTIVPTGEHIELAEVTIVSSKAPMMSSLSPYEADQAETVPSQVRTGPSVEPYDLSKLLNVD
ncbi:hypothetical protein PR202_ga27882 [Eleusine coracana subsp. coracana]|uniref:Uncharacterized protein n=1 Tax=Eleusine coracana subsp. coracana TaxID=191504 RepID=A0AAV5DIA8_ELECO|nr:hypothetical protein PR202_ga27882 [Eleusine coracana subsp. coracana]